MVHKDKFFSCLLHFVFRGIFTKFAARPYFRLHVFMKDLVTGGTGLVGAHLLYALTRMGRPVRALKRAGSRTDLLKALFAWYDPDKGASLYDAIEWVEGDVMDVFSLSDAMDGVQGVYHCAALVSFLPAERRQMMEVNVDGTAHLVDAALDKGIKKLVHCSSVAALGRPEQDRVADESLVWKSGAWNSAYALSKFGSEREAWRAAEEGMDVVIVNPSVVIGPGDPARSSAQLYLSVKKGLMFYTAGVTGFVDVRDVAESMVQLMESPISGSRFIVNAENLPYREVFTYFARHAGTRPPRYKAGPWLSEWAWRLEKLRSLLTRKPPLITRETARNANSKRYFSGDKLAQTLGFRYRTVNEAAANTAGFYGAYPGFLDG